MESIPCERNSGRIKRTSDTIQELKEIQQNPNVMVTKGKAGREKGTKG